MEESRVNDNSSMEPEDKISAVSMHKVLTVASADCLVSYRELVFNLTNIQILSLVDSGRGGGLSYEKDRDALWKF